MSDAKALIKNWGLPDRSSDRIQVTLRLPFTDYARLHALKEAYPARSVNDFMCDLLQKGLDDVVAVLPAYTISEEEASHIAGSAEDYERMVGAETGPRVTFEAAYARIIQEAKTDFIKEAA
jgi:hypothetical protein